MSPFFTSKHLRTRLQLCSVLLRKWLYCDVYTVELLQSGDLTKAHTGIKRPNASGQKGCRWRGICLGRFSANSSWSFNLLCLSEIKLQPWLPNNKRLTGMLQSSVGIVITIWLRNYLGVLCQVQPTIWTTCLWPYIHSHSRQALKTPNARNPVVSPIHPMQACSFCLSLTKQHT